MNEKAKEIGCTNTNFVNPNGVHNENHYTSAYDLALICQYAMKNETFRKLVSTISYKLPITNKYASEDRVFTTTNELIIVNNNNRSDNYYYKYATGIKTGYTTPAGNCLASSSSKDNLNFICVTLDAWQTDDFLSERYLDALHLFEYGYNTYTIKQVFKKDSAVQTIPVKNATRDTKKLDLVLENDLTVLIKKENYDSTLLSEVKLKENIKAPLTKGEVLGTLSYNVEGINYSANLVANNDVKKSRFFIRCLEFVFILFIVWLYFKSKKQNKRKNRRLKTKRKYSR